jgi:3-oxoacyl-[acyl-carrier-protein] synthase II
MHGLALSQSAPATEFVPPPVSLPARRRVVVTGMGTVNPLGTNLGTTWHAALAGESGITRLSRFASEGYAVHAAGQIRGFDATAIADRKERRHLDAFCLYGLTAALEAIHDAALTITPHRSDRIGVVMGSGFGGLGTFEHNHQILLRRGPERVGPHAIPAGMANAAAAQIAQRLCLTGPNQTVMTACAAGAHAIGTSLRLLQQGDADVMLAGGAEAPICRSAVAGFQAMGALSVRVDPTRASRPFDSSRDGFVLGEGAGVLVMEALEHARARGARIYAEVLGFGASSDAYHVCAPAPDGAGAVRAMSNALADARMAPDAVSYINAHGTSTHYNDLVESRAIRTVFGPAAPPISATKSMIGHLVGAGAAVESILTIMSLVEGVIPPTLNLEERDPECDLDVVADSVRPLAGRIALKNSFGFGGNNASLVFGAC